VGPNSKINQFWFFNIRVADLLEIPVLKKEFKPMYKESETIW
jgi:hypothetical protein